MKICPNCDGKTHLVTYEPHRIEVKCEVCNGEGVVKSAEPAFYRCNDCGQPPRKHTATCPQVLPVAPSENGIGSTLDDVIAHHESWCTYFAETNTKPEALREHQRMAETLRTLRGQLDTTSAELTLVRRDADELRDDAEKFRALYWKNEYPSEAEAMAARNDWWDNTTLVSRLCGIIRIPITDGMGATGGGDEPDNAEFHVTRKFATSLNREAAARIVELEKDAKRWRAVGSRLTMVDFRYEGPSGPLVAGIVVLPKDGRYPCDAEKIADQLIAIDENALAEVASL